MKDEPVIWVCLHVGLFILGLFIGTFGAADSPLARATMSHYVEPEYTSRLYALIGMAEVLGTFIGAPVLAAFFHIGLQKKGIWTGLPWFYLAFLSFVAWLALLFALGILVGLGLVRSGRLASDKPWTI